MDEAYSNYRIFISRIKASIDLVEYIGRDIELIKSGSWYIGSSKFHPPDDDPSFHVQADGQSWCDFSGGETVGGDVFTYIMKKDHCGFKTALCTAAKYAGIQMPDQDDEQYQKWMALEEEWRDVKSLLTKAADYYHEHLPEDIADEYFKSGYGFTDETIKGFKLGWADGNLWDHFRNVLGIEEEMALKTGLFVKTQYGIQDFFHNRLIFPYLDNGSAVYFIGRKTRHTPDKSWEEGKYKKLLTHSEKHFHVSETVSNDHIFNAHSAYGAREILITEGISDCISACQAEYTCISPVTTSFRDKDIPSLLQLTKHAERVIICNDNEENRSGEKGALKTAHELHAAGRDVRIAELPRPAGVEKVDINDYLKKHTPEEFKAVIDSAMRYPEFLIRRIPENTDSKDISKALRPVLEALCCSDPIEADAYLDEIQSRFPVKKRALNNLFKKVQKEHDSREKKEAARKKGDDKADEPRQERSESGLPQIQTNDRQLRNILQEIEGIIVQANAEKIQALSSGADVKEECANVLNGVPLLFVRSGSLVRLNIDNGRQEIEPLSEDGVNGILIRTADWVTINRTVTPSKPPREIPKDLLEYPPEKLPRLDAVITSPVFASDGSLITERGYYHEEAVWYQPTVEIEEIPLEPSKKDVDDAVSLIFDELLNDFIFFSDADRANILAVLLMPFVRRMIQGATPLHLLEAASPGTGKTLLADLVSIIATGKPCDPVSLPDREDEVRKSVTAELSRGKQIILFDNVPDNEVLNSAKLSSVATTEFWSDRLLGQSKIVTFPNKSVWLITGNNVNLSRELVRRCIRIRLSSDTEEPWNRTGFKHHPLREWTLENRAALIRALLTIGRGWIIAGKPSGEESLGSFESWSGVMSGILRTAEVDGFLENLSELYQLADSDTEMWREFINKWWSDFRGEEVSVSTLNDMCYWEKLMKPLLRFTDSSANQSILGKALVSARDRVYGDFQIKVVSYKGNRSNRYKLEKIGDTENEPEDTEETYETAPEEKGHFKQSEDMEE